MPCYYENIFKGRLRTLKVKTRKATQLNFYRAVALSAFLCKSESWANKTIYIKCKMSVDMRYLRTVEDYSRLRIIKGADVMKGLEYN